MKYNANNKPLACMQTQSTCYKETTKMTVKGVLWHSTGANNPWLKRYVQPSDNAADKTKWLEMLGKNQYGNDWNHIYHRVGLNCWIGKLANGTVTTVQTMPWDYRPWGCGGGSKGSCNDGWIQFEIQEDGLTDRAYFEKVYKEACEITAYLCDMFNIDPNGTVMHKGVKVPTILCHYDSYKLGLGSNHGDIYNWFTKFGKDMDDVRKDVSELLNPSVVDTKPTITSSFKAGDVVKIIGSTYYNGKSVPSWVLNKNWIVSSVSGDRVILDKSVDGKESIMSPFKSTSLTHVALNPIESETVVNKAPVVPAPKPQVQSITKGSVVSISNGAKYYNGISVPNWVIKKNWIVCETPVKDRVVIDKSTDGKYSIYSPISSKYLTVVANEVPLKKGSKVKIKNGAKTYTGGNLASFVYKETYVVLEEPRGNRVVIGRSNGIVIAAMNKKDLIIV